MSFLCPGALLDRFGNEDAVPVNRDGNKLSRAEVNEVAVDEDGTSSLKKEKACEPGGLKLDARPSSRDLEEMFTKDDELIGGTCERTNNILGL